MIDKEKGPIYKKIYIPKWMHTLPDRVKRKVNTKKICKKMSDIYLEKVNPYIPEKTGRMKRDGYLLQIANSRIKPWFKLTYRNTSKLPYVMYQYYGEVWENNYPKFETTPERFNPDNLKLREARIFHRHRGWFSSKHKTPTHRRFARRKKVVIINPTTKFTIEGYTTKPRSVQPLWVEYAEKKLAYGPFGYETEIAQYAERVYRAILAGDKNYVR